MFKSSPVWTAYQKLISTGRLKANAEQAALATQLAYVQAQLSTNASASASISGSWFSRSKRNNTQCQDSQNGGLYIYGGVGTGKSRIADLFASTISSLQAPTGSQMITCRRTHFFEFMSDIHMRLHRARASPLYAGDPLVEIGHEIKRESSALVLDEFMVTDIADAMILKRLFTSFWERGGLLVSTSNRHPRDLYKNGLNRSLFIPFIEELQSRCTLFEMTGQHDYRMDGERHATRMDVFFLDEREWKKEIETATDNHDFELSEVPVLMGRKLKVLAATTKPKEGLRLGSEPQVHPKPVVSSTFSALCDTSIGAADYHALCNFASTIYISGLRKFGSDELDIVRRFITLVDIAYESRTRVLCLSTEPMLKTFENIIMSGSLQQDQHVRPDKNGTIPPEEAVQKLREALLHDQNLVVKGEGGSSSSMMSTFLNNVEWSATGLKKASLATGGAGEHDVRFAVGRAISRLSEMTSASYGTVD